MNELALDLDDNDDIRFAHEISPVISGALRIVEPPEAYVVKIDHWFGAKWFAFSNKAMGAFGVHRGVLRVPPFVPARVQSQQLFRRSPRSEYRPSESLIQLHIEQTSEDNARRKMSSVCPGAAAFWWSGDSRRARRGCLMAYLPSHEGYTGWYAEFLYNDRWVVSRTRHTTARELAEYALDVQPAR
jgi:hypothetical protein